MAAGVVIRPVDDHYHYVRLQPDAALAEHEHRIHCSCEDTAMKRLLTSLMLATAATSALAVPPSEPMTLLGEARPVNATDDVQAVERRVQPLLTEGGSARTPLGQRLAEDGFERTPLGDGLGEDGAADKAEALTEDGFDRTPAGQQFAEDGSARTGIGRA